MRMIAKEDDDEEYYSDDNDYGEPRIRIEDRFIMILPYSFFLGE